MMHAPFLKHQQHPKPLPKAPALLPESKVPQQARVAGRERARCLLLPGLHGSFYRHRCLACETGDAPERRASESLSPGRLQGKAGGKRRSSAGSWVGPAPPTATPENPLKPGVKTGLKPRSDPGRPWHRVAGPSSALRTFAAAVVSDVIPDGPDGQWVGGSFERIEAENRKRLKEHLAKLAKDCLYQRDTPPTNLLGGYKFPGAPTAADLDLAKSTATVPDKIAAETARLIATIPANLSILNFLKRPPPELTCDQVDRFNTGAP